MTGFAALAEPRKAFWAKCADCFHVWPAAYYPMELGKFAEVTGRAICPNCGARGKKILIAKQDDGVLKEESVA